MSKSSWIATGCEDGTVRLTWYSPGIENWSTSKLLGEHVGGSAVRSICCVSKLHTIPSAAITVPDDRSEQNVDDVDKDNPTLLISVGAKRVLTSWLLKSTRLKNKTNFHTDNQQDSKEVDGRLLSSLSSSMTFQWLSTDMPTNLQKYLKEDGVNITANSLHPGTIVTNLFRHNSAVNSLIYVIGKPVLKNAQQGAATTMLSSIASTIEGSKEWSFDAT